MKKFFVVLTAMVMALSANAQFMNSSSSSSSSRSYEGYSRINFGYDMRSYTYKYGSHSKSLATTNGGTFEYLRGINIVPSLPIYLEVGGKVVFNTGAVDDYDYSEDHLTTLALSIPVNAGYKFNIGDGGFYIEPYAGMHFRFNVLAIEGGDYVSDNTNLLSKDDMGENYAWNFFQFGGQVGVTFGFNKFNFGVAYIMDTPIWSYDGEKYTNSEFEATIGFTF